ncbi:glycosyltransferase [Pseudokineococcus marinus]|uniref:Glycosyltransferase n=1 Tax=Pseudokineococcus marinus TaxID=351215 RepID=A0A849BJZ9_9ACTN|nr:glycosyltransferase [Pseudokineococcus marinus]
MSAPPSVTVVIPTKDRPELLLRAIAAVQDQDYEGVVETVVVVDEGGRTPDGMPSRPGRPLSVVANDRSPGLAGARNAGVDRVSTPFVAFCDDDDVWHPSKLRRQVAAVQQVPGAVLVTCGIRVVYEQTTVVRALPRTRIGFDDLLRSRLTELHPSTFLLDTARLRSQVGPVEEDIPGSYAEDYDFLLRVARASPVVNLPEAMVDVHWHRRSYFAGRWDTISAALRWLLARYPEFDREPAGRARVLGQIAFADAAAGRRRGAVAVAVRALRDRPQELRAVVALAVATGLVRPAWVLAALHRRGRGV